MRHRSRGISVGIVLLLLAMVAAIVLIWRFTGASGEQTEAPSGQSLFTLDFAAPTVGGDAFSLADHRGRVVLVNIFSTGCPPCRAETPHLVKLYGEQHEAGLDVVMVSRESVSVVSSFAEQYHVPYPMIANGGAVLSQVPNLRFVPTTLLVDAAGRVRYRVTGADLARIRKGVATLLAERK